MLNTRQNQHGCPKLPGPVFTLTHEFDDGAVIPVHHHREDQLVYACRGVMTVRTKEGIWVVPPRRAVWIPAHISHGITMSGAVSMRTLYLRPGLVRHLPRSCRVVNVSILLKELILHACAFRVLKRRIPEQAHLIDFVIDQLSIVEVAPLQLPTPHDGRALRVAEALSGDPGDQRPLEEICRTAGASKRTIERLFQLEANMTLGEWRQQLRLMRSLPLLAAGEKISRVAMEAGYSTPSSFIAMFRKMLGTTPSRYFAEPIERGGVFS